MRQLKTNRLSQNQILIIVVCVLLFAVAGSYIAFNSDAAPKPKPTGTATMSISPASSKLSTGSPLSLQIWENSHTTTVNAVQANLTYDVSKLTFMNIDASNSAFSIEAQSIGGNGVVQIGRGEASSLSGNQLVATVNFSVTGSSGKTSVSFAKTSKIASATDNTDILGRTYGGSYNIR